MAPSGIWGRICKGPTVSDGRSWGLSSAGTWGWFGLVWVGLILGGPRSE